MEVERAILVVDDEVTILEIVRTVLQEEGYVVLAAADGAEALDVVRETRPTLILLDMWMPKVNGWQFAEAYRKLPGPHAPIIAMTAARDSAKVRSEIGAIDSLGKPFEIDDLINAVERQLNGTQQE